MVFQFPFWVLINEREFRFHMANMVHFNNDLEFYGTNSLKVDLLHSHLDGSLI